MAEWTCLDCGYEFDSEDYWGRPERCCKCCSLDIIPTEQARENARINAEDDYKEDLRR